MAAEEGTPLQGMETGSDSRDLKDLAGFLKNASWSADYQERLNGLPGTGDRAEGRALSVRGPGPTDRSGLRTCGAERLRLVSSRIGMVSARCAGAAV
jgi:hypothetical protein